MDSKQIEIREETTGAIRSADLDAQRWDLISGVAVRTLKEVSEAQLNAPPERLVQAAIDYLWRFAGFDTYSINHEGIIWPEWIDPNDRLTLLCRGWWCLAIAIQRIDEPFDGIKPTITPLPLPYHAFKRLARACAEGVVKYGEENWHNGFRTKEVVNHALSHLIKWTNGYSDEDDLGHAMWNFMVAVHNMIVRPELNDLLLGYNYGLTDELRAYHAKKKEERGIKVN